MLTRRAKIFAATLAICVTVAVVATVLIYDILLSKEFDPDWKPKDLISETARQQPMPENAKAWSFGVQHFKLNDDGSYDVGGISLISYHDKEMERRHWEGVAEIHAGRVTFRAFELGPILTPDEWAKHTEGFPPYP